MAPYRRFLGITLFLIHAPLWAEGIRIVNEGGIRDEWMLAPGSAIATPVYPVRYAEGQKQACVALGYLVNLDGSTSDFALLKNWSSATIPSGSKQDYWTEFALASAQAVGQWQFRPRPEIATPRPVYTVATMLFAGATPELRSRCKVPDLAARLLELRRTSPRNHRNAALFERLDMGRYDPLERQRRSAD